MRAVIQRARHARVTVDGVTQGKIAQGLLVLFGVGEGDSEADGDYLAAKIAGLRVFQNDDGKMSLSVRDIGGAVLVVSQFTLYGDVRRGLRPSFDGAAQPQEAARLYDYFCARLRQEGLTVETGVFQATMDVELLNDGPVTILLDSQKTF
jgi:D-tyrosyl-tRNA(Tyr) deacylase